jgi:hypothetical protein
MQDKMSEVVSIASVGTGWSGKARRYGAGGGGGGFLAAVLG